MIMVVHGYNRIIQYATILVLLECVNEQRLGRVKAQYQGRASGKEFLSVDKSHHIYG